MDYMIDIKKELEGKNVCGMRIPNVDILENLADKHICCMNMDTGKGSWWNSIQICVA